MNNLNPFTFDSLILVAIVTAIAIAITFQKFRERLDGIRFFVRRDPLAELKGIMPGLTELRDQLQSVQLTWQHGDGMLAIPSFSAIIVPWYRRRHEFWSIWTKLEKNNPDGRFGEVIVSLQILQGEISRSAEAVAEKNVYLRNSTLAKNFIDIHSHTMMKAVEELKLACQDPQPVVAENELTVSRSH